MKYKTSNYEPPTCKCHVR